jgi:hypothetical protein
VSADAITQQPARTLWRDDLVAALTGGLLILGLFLDGWNHLNLQEGKAGEFLTPWHGLLYAGFNACAIWAITRNTRLRAMMFKRPGAGGAKGGVAAKRAPQFNAAHVALLGLGLAGAGVIGDAIARAAGVVSAEGAMQPPFDFLLFTGAGLLLAIALRSAAAQIEGFGKRVVLPAVVGIGAAAAVVFAFGGPAATKSVDKVVRTIAAQPSVVQSAPRTAPAARHARHTAARVHHHRVAASTHGHRAHHASRSHAAATVSVSAAAGTHAGHHASSSHHASRTVVIHRRASRHVTAAPHRRSAARPAPHRTHAQSKGRFQQVAIPDVPSSSPSSTAPAPASSNSGSSSSAPAATSPAASPTAAPTPSTSNPPATVNPPATAPTAVKHGGPGQG